MVFKVVFIEFISSHSKKKLEELKHSLEHEDWQPADIPYAYAVYFNLIFGVKTQKDSEHKQDIDKSIIGEEESVILDDILKIEDLTKNGKLAEEFYSIKKNEIFVKEKRFRTISSFLLLIKLVCEDFHIALKFNSLGTEAVSKIFETMKVLFHGILFVIKSDLVL